MVMKAQKVKASDRVYRALDAVVPATAKQIAAKAEVHIETARRALRKYNDGEAVSRLPYISGKGYQWLGVQRWLL